jgi:NAD+ diphosphatase
MTRRYVVTHAKGIVTTSEGRALLEEAELAAIGLDAARARLLRAPSVDAAGLSLEGEPPEGFALMSLRVALGALRAADVGAVVRAAQLASFVETHGFCGRCAAPLADEPHEIARKCPACALVVYPRVTPAVIMLVRKERRALLARNARFPVPFYSALAGFVEIGETLEETVAREVREEVGVEVTNVRYFGSQPWPFPGSLMIGFTADWAGGDIQVDGTEIAEARFFDPEELPNVPPPISIARQLIDAWVDETA